jgi:hypothetical protein
MGECDEASVPSPERQRWLIQQTRVLLSAGGVDAFLRAPLLEPTPKFFPEGWSHRGRRVKRRIGNKSLAYAAWSAAIAGYVVFLLIGFGLELQVRPRCLAEVVGEARSDLELL